MTKVLILPTLDQISGGEGGIHTLIRKYHKYLPQHGIECVTPNDEYDVIAIHAGLAMEGIDTRKPIVAHTHGLYWTADYDPGPHGEWQHWGNHGVIETVRRATVVTCPSQWVAQTFRRDMHLNPAILPHGIDLDEWQGGEDGDYVLWNKNRNTDVCKPDAVNFLARQYPRIRFLTTFAGPDPTPNMKVTGPVAHERMKEMVKNCAVYLSTTKETFGIGILEAMAAGKPILGFREGNITSFVQHGVNGYLARPNSWDDLQRGLRRCVQRARQMGDASREIAQQWGWQSAISSLAAIYKEAAAPRDQGVTVVIPCYNKRSTLRRAVESALAQSHTPAAIYIVDNNSTDGSLEIAQELEREHSAVVLLLEGKQGVAHARNRGIYVSHTRYICCLDADDEIHPDFLQACVQSLESNSSIGIAYTGMEVVDEQGNRHRSEWPGAYRFQGFAERRNQVPTCCVFRRDVAVRLGGYRQRYAPWGAGSEDANLWYRFGANGYAGVQSTPDPLLRYYLGGQVSGDPSYSERDWLDWYPWLHDDRYPVACLAPPVNGIAHLAHQYDTPRVSVIIPVTESHSQYVVDAMDSLEGQGMRDWEAILVWDGEESGWDEFSYVASLYPYATIVRTPQPHSGAGAARNLGVTHASADKLLFLDADDWLRPAALRRLLEAHERDGAIAYSDYIGHAYMDPGDDLTALWRAGRLRDYDARTGEASVYHHAAEFDCPRAVRQPDVERGQLYIWNLITSLVPKAWHDHIGGFDESMESWEDWDYWIRMAREGYCFTRISEPLVEYRFYTGSRRSKANPDESGESGRQLSAKLLQYLVQKREQGASMCGSCGKSVKSATPSMMYAMAGGGAMSLNMGVTSDMNANDMIRVKLVDGNRGDHPITFQGTNYGYRKDGDTFLMKRAHADLDRRVVAMDTVAPPTEAPKVSKPSDLEIPEPRQVRREPPRETVEDMPEPYDLTQIWGVGEQRAAQLREMGVRSPQGVVTLGKDKIEKFLGVVPSHAARIISSAKEEVERLAKA